MYKRQVHELDGFTLAIELVAILLGLPHLNVSPSQYLNRLKKEGSTIVDELAENPEISSKGVRHRERQLSIILGQTKGALDELSIIALTCASLMHPDFVVWQWVKRVVSQLRPELLEHRPGYPDPWMVAKRRLCLLYTSPSPRD